MKTLLRTFSTAQPVDTRSSPCMERACEERVVKSYNR